MIVIVVLVWISVWFLGNYGGAVNWIGVFVLIVFLLIDVFVLLFAAV